MRGTGYANLQTVLCDIKKLRSRVSMENPSRATSENCPYNHTGMKCCKVIHASCTFDNCSAFRCKCMVEKCEFTAVVLY